MATVTFRPDYAKFVFEVSTGLFDLHYRAFCELSHQMKFAGDFLKSHKTNRLWYNKDKDMETWTLEVWGEWAGIVEKLPADWVLLLKRYDVRAVVWDATKDTILDLGQHLQRNVNRYNVNVYNTKPASKRMGRDRGGVGFAIGSHKSDLRVTCYKRTGEPVAQEFQCTGAMLNGIKLASWDWYQKTSGTTDIWKNLTNLLRKRGNIRLSTVLENAGVGTYWPTVGPQDLPQLPPLQAGFIAEVQDILDDDDLIGRSDLPSQSDT